MIAILTKIWDISWDMWEHRNGIAHGTLNPSIWLSSCRLLCNSKSATFSKQGVMIYCLATNVEDETSPNIQLKWTAAVYHVNEQMEVLGLFVKETYENERTEPTLKVLEKHFRQWRSEGIKGGTVIAMSSGLLTRALEY
jgi:hypothetical protein